MHMGGQVSWLGEMWKVAVGEDGHVVHTGFEMKETTGSEAGLVINLVQHIHIVETHSHIIPTCD